MKLTFGRMFQDGLDADHGLPRSRLQELIKRFRDIQAEVRARRSEGEYGFYSLADQAANLKNIRSFAEGLGQAHEHVLVLGIGGSALGTRALLNSLKSPAWNELDDEARDFFPRLTVLDNVDPGSVAGALARIDPRRVLVNVVSKSGGTAETLAQYLVVRQWLEDVLGAAAYRHFVFTTDPTSGALREIARKEGIATLEVPPEVGGRFSVLSPAGLLPAALVGIDIGDLLTGARRALEEAEQDDLQENRAALFAALLWAADATEGARIHYLMPYTDRLREFAEWYRQLWAESLGKRLDRRGQVVHAGPTPVGSIGTTDQHSQMQLLMEGPFDKVVSFITVDEFENDVAIPAREGLPEELQYLQGHTLGQLLRAEYEATAAALASQGRMSMTLRLPRVDAESMGELFMFFQLAAGYAGAWYGVNPFDQPGVELGKRLSYAALGRPGYELSAASGRSGGSEI
ncbi:MAG: glucose-6-phosphate isomerase [Gemmatimonadales bacterium]